MQNLNNIELEDLLKLLEETSELTHNDPFVLFLKSLKIEKGTTQVKIEDLIKFYNNLESKKIKLEKAIEVCKGYLEVVYNKAIPYFSINQDIDVKRPNTYSRHNKMRYEHFLEINGLSPGDYIIDRETFYNYYDTWCYETRKPNQFTKKEFYKLSGLFLKGKVGRNFNLNKDIKNFLKQGDVSNWRKQLKNDEKKEKA